MYTAYLLVAVADQQTVIVKLRIAFDSNGHFYIERIQHIGVDQTNGVSFFRNQGYGYLIGNIVHLPGYLLNPLLGLLGDAVFFAA